MATSQATRSTAIMHAPTAPTPATRVGPDPLARFRNVDLPRIVRQLADQRDDREHVRRAYHRNRPRTRADIYRDNTGDLATIETGAHTVRVRAQYMPSSHVTRLTFIVDGVRCWKDFQSGRVEVAPDCTGVTPTTAPTATAEPIPAQ